MKTWQKFGYLVLAMTVGISSLQAQTTLRYKFKEGDQFAYAMEQKMKMSTNIMGKALDMQMNQTMDIAWKVLKVEASGAAQVNMAITRARMTMDGPMGKVEVDSKDPKQPDDPLGKILSQVMSTIGGMEMSFTMDPTGEMKDLKVPEKVRAGLQNLPGGAAMGDMFSDESLKKMASGGVVFPKEPIEKGKSWTTKFDAKMPLGRLKGDIQYTYEGQEEKNGKKLEKIALKPNISIEADPKAPVQSKLKSQEGKGYVYFDNASGKLIELDSTQNMEMSIDAGNMNFVQKVEQSTLMKLAK